MKKVLALVLALVLCVGILAGCQETPVETTKPTETQGDTDTQATDPVETEYTFPALKCFVSATVFGEFAGMYRRGDEGHRPYGH